MKIGISMSAISKNNIWIIVQSYPPAIGGIETFTKMLAEGLADRNYQIHVLVTGRNIELGGLLNTVPTNLKIVRPGNPFHLFICFLKCDLIVFSNFSLSYFPLVWLSRTRSLVIHHVSPFCHDRALNWREKVKQLVFTKTINIFVSENLKVLSGLNGDVIHNGTPFLIDAAKNSDRRTYEFLFLGRLIPEKGVRTAILAFSKIAPLQNGYVFNIVGEGESRRELEQLTRHLNLEANIRFLGSMDEYEIRELLKRHKFLLFPSEWREPFGLVAIEALTQGCIPIVADSGGILEACKNFAIPFKAGDTSKLAEILESSLANYSIIYDSIFDEIDFKVFTAETMLEKYDRAIQEVLNL